MIPVIFVLLFIIIPEQREIKLLKKITEKLDDIIKSKNLKDNSIYRSKSFVSKSRLIYTIEKQLNILLNNKDMFLQSFPNPTHVCL